MTMQYQQPNINIANGALFSRFTVGPVGSGAPFTSIQAAIDAAVLEAPSITQGTPIVISITPGIYEEDITAGAGIAMVATFELGVVIRGTITYNLDQVIVADNGAALQGIQMEPPPGSPALVFTGPNNQNVLCFGCSFTAQGAPAIIDSNTGSSSLDFSECTIEYDATGSALDMSDGGFFRMTDTDVFGPSGTPSINVEDSFIQILDSNIDGAIVLINAFALINRTDLESSGVPPLRLTDAGAGAELEYCTLRSFGTGGVLVDGVGTLSFSAIAGIGGAPTTSFDPGLTLFPILSNSAENLQYNDNTAGAWAAPAPVDVNDAIDRMATALSIEIGGPIP